MGYVKVLIDIIFECYFRKKWLTFYDTNMQNIASKYGIKQCGKIREIGV